MNEYYAINRPGNESDWMIPVTICRGDDIVGIYLIEYGSKINENSLYFDEYGYNFIGFSLNKELTDIIPDDYEITEGTTLYVASEPEQYTVIFKDYNGNVIDTQVVAYMESAVEPEVTVEEEGMVFAGWNTDDFLCVTEDTEVYAVIMDLDDVLGIKLSRDTYSMIEGYSYTLNATINGKTDAELFWSSSDESIATVDENGKVTALSDGFVVITASLLGTDVSESCYITIGKNPDTSITVDDDSAYFEYNGYICGISPSANTAETVISELNGYNIKLYKDNIELAADDLVSTGTVAKLFDEGNTEVDSVILVVIGDVDGDGYTNNPDAAHISSYLVGNETLEDCYLIAADVNADGQINNKDASMIMRYQVNKERI